LSSVLATSCASGDLMLMLLSQIRSQFRPAHCLLSARFFLKATPRFLILKKLSLSLASCDEAQDVTKFIL